MVGLGVLIYLFGLSLSPILSGISHSFDFDCIIFQIILLSSQSHHVYGWIIFNLSAPIYYTQQQYKSDSLTGTDLLVDGVRSSWIPDKSSNGLHLPFGFMSPFFDGFVFTRGIFAFFLSL